ncbi:unnamed protein product [Knipowitschia caucasica]
MESLQLHSDEAVRTRPQREIRLPQHLDNYEVGYQPSVTTPSAVITLPASTTTADHGAAAVPKLVEPSQCLLTTAGNPNPHFAHCPRAQQSMGYPSC